MIQGEDWRNAFLAACEHLPEKVEVPYELTAEGERAGRFKRVLPREFHSLIDRNLLTNKPAFDKVVAWDGAYPGPCLYGRTDTAKTRAAWALLHELFVKQNKPFAWFPVKRLIGEFELYDSKSMADEFFRQYDFFKVLFIDDVDKINWQWEGQAATLFSFYDWVYRMNKPCITTTNKDRKWWTDKMGEAFARRLFEDAHFAVLF